MPVAAPAERRVTPSQLRHLSHGQLDGGRGRIDVHRAAGVKRARAVVADLRHRLSLDVPTEVRVLEAALIKARHALAYADAFAIATALSHGAQLLTGDPEILDDGDPSWPVVDLRS